MHRFKRMSVVVFLCVSSTVFAYQNGISGYSGKNGSTCSSCHGGGATPTVALSGPATLQTGQRGTYTLTITGGAGVQGGLDVATDAAGALLAAGPGTQLLNGEVTQSSPGRFSGGALSFSFSVTAPTTAGSFKLFAAGLSSNGSGTSGDGTGATSQTVTVTASAPANVAPTVSLTGPTAGSTFTAPANITLSANASDSDGTVARVDFYAGTTLLGSDVSSPFSFAWANVAAGTYSLTAKATDNAGASTTSAAIVISVAAPQVIDAGAPQAVDAGAPQAVDAGAPLPPPSPADAGPSSADGGTAERKCLRWKGPKRHPTCLRWEEDGGADDVGGADDLGETEDELQAGAGGDLVGGSASSGAPALALLVSGLATIRRRRKQR